MSPGQTFGICPEVQGCALRRRHGCIRRVPCNHPVKEIVKKERMHILLTTLCGHTCKR